MVKHFTVTIYILADNFDDKVGDNIIKLATQCYCR